jgi:uncharacterized protein YjbI with pentapeptide repeats
MGVVREILKRQKRNISFLLATVICFSVGVHFFGWGWTGLNSYTTTKTNSKGEIEFETHRGKTFWDMLDLIIVPGVLGLGAFLLNKAQTQNEQSIALARTQNEQSIALAQRRNELLIASNQQEELFLQNYIDAMTTLILEKNLCHTADEDLRNVARSCTLITLRALETPNQDGNNRRRASLLRFLYETKLINGDNPIISLKKANFEVSYIRSQNLQNADLQGANFYKADLRDVNFEGANLEGAYLVEAKLQGANLSGARLKDATMKGTQYGKYVNTTTKWPTGFIPRECMIKEDLENSENQSKYIIHRSD